MDLPELLGFFAWLSQSCEHMGVVDLWVRWWSVMSEKPQVLQTPKALHDVAHLTSDAPWEVKSQSSDPKKF